MATATVSQSPTDPAFVQNPYDAYREFRRHQTIWWEEYGMWVFPRFRDVSAIFRDRRFGRDVSHVATREELGWDPIPEHLSAFYAFEAHSMLDKEPPAHTRLRALVNRAFVSRQVENLRPRIEQLSRERAAGLKEGDDLLADYCTPIPVTVIAELLGVPVETTPQLLDWSHRMVAMYQARRDRALEEDASSATEEFTAFLFDTIAHRRQSPGSDLLSALIAAEEAGDRLTPEELVSSAILLLNAGHEATVHALGNAIRTLALANFKPKPEAIPGMVEELLRFDPPLHMFTRYALEDLNWDGLALAKGEEVGLLIGSANRDDDANPDADRFDPARARVQHVSLGGGIHFCVGAPLARLEMDVALSVLFETLGPNAVLHVGEYTNTYHFHGVSDIRLGAHASAMRSERP